MQTQGGHIFSATSVSAWSLDTQGPRKGAVLTPAGLVAVNAGVLHNAHGDCGIDLLPVVS